MNNLVIYDSSFGNTQRIAEAISKGLGGTVKSLRVSEAKQADYKDMDLIVFGSPTQGGRPTPAMNKYIKNMPEGMLLKTNVAVFDTRFTERSQNFGSRMLMKMTGYAAEKMGKALEAKGGVMLEEPQGFIVENKEGPLRSAEFERAKLWGSELQKKLGN